MGSGLQCDAALRYPRKCLLHCFRCRRHFLFQNDLARFIQNAVERPAIAEVQTNREPVSFENHVSIYQNSASLFHSRSPFHCALSTSIIGSVSHPAETGPLIPSDKRGGLNGSTQHSSRTRLALKTKAKSLARVRSAGTLPWLGFDRGQPNRSLLPGKYCRINALDGVASTG